MSLSAGALVTLDEAKGYCDVTGSDQDSELERIVEAATGLCSDLTGGRKLKAATYTLEVYDGTGCPELRLRQFPVTSVTAVEELTGHPNTYTAVNLTTYPILIRQDAGRQWIVFRNYAFACGEQNIKVTYVAGYAATDPEMYRLKEACLMIVSDLLLGPDQQIHAVQSQGIQGQTVVLTPPSRVPVRARGILQGFARMN